MVPMTVKEIVDAHEGSIRVHLSDGRSLIAGEAEHVVPAKTHLIVAHSPDEYGLPTKVRKINYRQIVEIEALPPVQGLAG
jgi:hypothetical protein